MSQSSEQQPQTGRRWIVLKTILLVVGTVTISLPSFHGNVGIVDPGKVYRSAQPVGGLRRFVRERNLASVLDLRAGSPADWWYDNEVRVCRDSGVAFYDFPMSPERRPTRRELLVLIDFFQQCRYPLLIHCKSGSDRTGLASAIYLMVAREVPPVEAERAFSLRYWHIPVLGKERLHDPLVEYAAWLARTNQSHSSARFRTWVEQNYESVEDVGPYRPLEPGPRPQIVANPRNLSR